MRRYDIDRQSSYNYPWARWERFYGIAQIAPDAQGPSC